MLSLTMFMLMNNMLLFYFLNNPLSMGTLIIVQTMLISLIVFMLSSSWFSFILIMVFLSGIMILFSYISALSNNKIYFFKSYKMMLICAFFSITVSMMIYLDFIPIKLKWNNMEKSLILNNFQDLYNMYYNFTALMTMFLMMYLLIVLIIVTKNVNITKGPLKYK